jgi:hypothetical protein
MKTWREHITSTYAQKRDKKWDKLYWIIDLHDTVITGKYNKFNVGAELYPYAKETLDFLHEHPVHQTILWTSSHDDALEEITTRFALKFNYLHTNPECPTTDMCNFDRKLYFNFILDDKALFDPLVDWKDIYNILIELNDSI